MSNANLVSMLLIDNLQRTLANPTASQRWHALLELYIKETREDVKDKVRQALLAGVPKRGVQGFLLTTFLYDVTGQESYLVEAGALLQTLEPLDPDRHMAFAVYVWGVFISKGGDRARFVDVLRRMGVHESIAKAGQHLLGAASKTLPARTIDKVRKVALVAAYIGQDSHAPTPLALRHAKLLQSLGYEVQLFAAQEMRVQDMESFFGNAARLTTFPPDFAELKKAVPTGVNLTLSDDRFSMMRRWSDLMVSIGKFDPDLVMFVGLNSPLMMPLHQARPVLGLCVHAVQPMAVADVWLAADQAQAGVEGKVWSPALPPALGFYHPFRINLKPLGPTLRRADLGVRDNAIVLLSVGARLNHEVAGPWGERMAAFLLRHPEVQWLLVGGVATRPDALAAVPKEQTALHAYRNDMRNVMQTADIYVNPPRVGGGFSVAEAMAEGLAVTAFANSDGGDKIGAAAVSDIDAYFNELEALVGDAALRRSRGEAMRKLFAETLDLDNSGESLRRACDLTLERFRQRTAS